MSQQIQVLVMIRDGAGQKVTVTSGLHDFPREMTIDRAAQFALAQALEKVGVKFEPRRHD